MTIGEAQKRREEICDKINRLSGEETCDIYLMDSLQKEAQELWEFINKEK